MSETVGIIPIQDLITEYADWKYGHGKTISIIRSSLSLVSMAASSLLIHMMRISQDGMGSTYHRLLVGMSISDIVLSTGFVSFNAMAPKDSFYEVWNARGNQATCDAMGFLVWVGAASGVYYTCSINVFYLAKVKYNMSDAYLKSKIEPFLHGVPILLAIIPSILFLVFHHYNADAGGSCSLKAIYYPAHCIGYDIGQIRDGFNIPCGRGYDGLPRFAQAIIALIYFFLPPFIIGALLLMIYRKVLKQERVIANYGAGSLNQRAATTNDGGADDKGKTNEVESSAFVNFFRSGISSLKKFGRRSSSSSSPEHALSRAVLHKALAYSTAYILTWMWMIIAMCLFLAGVWGNNFPSTGGQIAYRYLWVIFNPLRGLANLLIFLHPQVEKEKKRSSGENISWFKAFRKAFWYSATGVIGV